MPRPDVGGGSPTVRYPLRLRIVGLLLLCLAPVVAGSTVLLLRVSTEGVWGEAEQAARSFADTVLSATRHSMLTVDRTELEAIIAAVSRQRGVRSARVYDGRGRSRVPRDPPAPDLDLDGSGCKGCHRDPRTLSGPARVCAHRAGDTMRLFLAIPNEPECAGGGCHGVEEGVLGILGVELDLSAALAKARRLAGWAAGWGLLVLAGAAVPLYLAFRWAMEHPLAECLRLVRGAARGDLTLTSRLDRTDEWGELLAALDSMAGALRSALGELEQLNRSLEGQVRDRTRALEQALALARESDLMKSEFLAAVGHEFATPLQGAIGYAELLLDGVDGDLAATQRHDLEVIRRNNRHLLGLVEDLIDLARLGGAASDRPAVRFSPASVAREVAEAGRRLAGGTAVAVTLESGAGGGDALGDPEALRHLLFHVVEYAVRYAGAGTVAVRAPDPVDGRPEVGVEAAGSERAARVLESALTGYAPQGGGGGVGLRVSFARRLVELRGGEVLLGRGPLGGACVRVRLPPAEPP
ncbi:MAG: sensor histidine kinase [Deferrisomatales bacterium]